MMFFHHTYVIALEHRFANVIDAILIYVVYTWEGPIKINDQNIVLRNKYDL